ncbi:MAG: GNAT family N-acetyltransferase [Blastocatellia bacterium]|nr:GNAT family N-acetyltransferase [Blastocatellia bacterium]
MNYRTAGEGDLRVLAEMRWDFRTEGVSSHPPISKTAFIEACVAFLERGLTAGRWIYWVAESEGKIVSHIFIQRIETVPNPDRLEDEYGYVTNVYTKPAYRGVGIGAELMLRAKQWAERENLETLIVWPSEESVSFYERAGFTPQNDMLECKIRSDDE